MKKTRRKFIKRTGIVTAGAVSGLGNISARSYRRIIGSNERINTAVVGLNGRGGGLMNTILKLENSDVIALCDVDRNVLDKRVDQLKEEHDKSVSVESDFRRLVQNPDIDAIFIASADHTHTPFSILAMQTGKHVYCEKPLSHNPNEGALLVIAQRRYGKLVQIGNQQRSAPTSQMMIKDIAGGIIGDVYEATCWYANSRGTIGVGKVTPVPDHLDWDLWQGPAPRKQYRDNIVHYNWHWFRHWGTGEICNNGLHEMDICRWALGVKHPTSVTSEGGRFHYQNDDWEFYDTQIARFEFEGGKSLTWDGRSCNGIKKYDRGRGVLIYGTEGSIMVDRNDYYVYDREGNEIKHKSEEVLSQTTNIAGIGGLTDKHIHNFFEGIRKGETLNSPVAEANFSNHLCHLGNMAQATGTKLEVDVKSGIITNNKEALRMWSREYAPGWELTN